MVVRTKGQTMAMAWPCIFSTHFLDVIRCFTLDKPF